MTSHTLHIIGAHAARPGTAMRSRIGLNRPVVWLTRRPDAYVFGVTSKSPGGRTP